MNKRYEAVLEPTGLWSVFDDEEGIPAMIGDRILIGLSEDEAEKAVILLSQSQNATGRSVA
jgi:hypothetical protein